jgi:hypothetical protein
VCPYEISTGLLDSVIAKYDGPTNTPAPLVAMINSQDPDSGVKIFFENGEPYLNRIQKVTLQLPCDELADPMARDMTVTENTVFGTFDFSYPTKWSCVGASTAPEPEDEGISGGWIFIIIVLCVAFLYTLIGCLWKSQKMGAAGMERSPNIDFWRTLPGLTRDGFVFTYRKLSSCCGGGGGGGGGPVEPYEEMN